ncbi:DNA adenine methylase [Aerococcus viridans]
MKTTKQIETEYSISRQTLNKWIKYKVISSPKKDWRGWYCWDKENEEEIQSILTTKEEQYNTVQGELFKEEEELETLHIFNRRYLGSKKKLLNFILETVKEYDNQIYSVADIFSGTGVVADQFRQKGKKVIVNDILKSNYVTYHTWFGNEEIDENKIQKRLHELNKVEGTENYVSLNFGDKYFTMENAKKIGEIRERIELMDDLNIREKSFLLTSLIYAMDKVANTVGHYDAYRRTLDTYNPLILKMPLVNKNNDNEIFCEDANQLVRKIKADLVYIDTPYNSRQYGDAYHLLENIINWEKPPVIGVAKKMPDRSGTKSLYSTSKAPLAFNDLVEHIDAKYILVSYSNMAKKGNARSNAKISNEEIIDILKQRGKVQVFESSFNPFTTGKSVIEDHKELLYLCEVGIRE